jgi:uncharacterized membrane protein YccF (DUF307 family)
MLYFLYSVLEIVIIQCPFPFCRLSPNKKGFWPYQSITNFVSFVGNTQERLEISATSLSKFVWLLLLGLSSDQVAFTRQ